MRAYVCARPSDRQPHVQMDLLFRCREKSEPNAYAKCKMHMDECRGVGASDERNVAFLLTRFCGTLQVYFSAEKTLQLNGKKFVRIGLRLAEHMESSVQ